MKILLLGKGYVAQHFKDFYGDQAVISDHYVGDYSALLDELSRQQPDVVVNCIGKTGRPNVDWCEDHKMETLFANVTVPLLLARACEELGLYMVHIGSGCVYEGYKGGEGFAEQDAPNFDGSFYSRTKAWSEAMLKEFPVLQLRLRMPLDSKPGPRNFVTKIAKYPKILSTQNSISVLEDFIQAADALIQRRLTGVFNVTNPGTIDHARILEMYKELVDPNHQYELIDLEEHDQMLKARRSSCGLSVRKLEDEGIVLRPVEEAVREALVEYAKYLA